MERLEIFRGVHGSHLYGTNIEGSDTDYKAVWMVPKWVGDPLEGSWQLGLDHYMRCKGNYRTLPTATGEGEEKEEVEFFYIQEFAKLLSSMQTVCMSMVYSPREQWINSSPAWEDLVANRHRLASKAIMPYVGYARGQSVKYTLKGERLATLEAFIQTVHELIPIARSNDGILRDDQWCELVNQYKDREGVRVWENVLPIDPYHPALTPQPEQYIQVIGKSFSQFSHVKDWTGPLESVLNSFGKRAKAAKEDKADLKACMHAVRIVREAKELLLTSELVYPSPDREFYLQIRRNEFSYDEIQDMMIKEMDELETLLAASTLPDQPDREWLANWAVRWQKDHWGL